MHVNEIVFFDFDIVIVEALRNKVWRINLPQDSSPQGPVGGLGRIGTPQRFWYFLSAKSTFAFKQIIIE